MAQDTAYLKPALFKKVVTSDREDTAEVKDGDIITLCGVFA